jgi:hypothetical protein
MQTMDTPEQKTGLVQFFAHSECGADIDLGIAASSPRRMCRVGEELNTAEKAKKDRTAAAAAQRDADARRRETMPRNDPGRYIPLPAAAQDDARRLQLTAPLSQLLNQFPSRSSSRPKKSSGLGATVAGRPLRKPSDELKDTAATLHRDIEIDQGAASVVTKRHQPQSPPRSALSDSSQRA